MPLINGTFVTAGAQRYEAASWTRATYAPARTIAGFAGDETTQDLDGKEGFEAGWGAKKFLFRGFFQDLAYAFFDFSTNTPKTVEDFEDLWGAGPAIVTSEPGPFALAVGQTLLISVMDREPVTVTFAARHFNDITDARPGEVANALNEVLVDARATVHGDRVRIVSHRTGPAIHLWVTGGTARDTLFDVPNREEMAGMAEGATFFRRIEFDFRKFGDALNEYEGFGKGYGPVSLTSDPADTSGRLTVLHAPDALGWVTLVPTITLVATTNAEHFYDWAIPDGLYMQTTFSET